MEQSPGFFQLIRQAWRDGWCAICRMPWVFLTLAILFVICEAALFFLELGPSSFSKTAIIVTFYSSPLLHVINLLITGALLCALMITVQRFVLLGEVSRWGALKWNRRFARFYLWFLILCAVLFFVPVIIGAVGNSHVWKDLSFLCKFALVYWAIRIFLILPAIASDSPFANYRNAMQLTRGHFWFIFGVKAVNAFVLSIPVWVLMVIGMMLGYFHRSNMLSVQPLAPWVILGGVIIFVALIVFMVFMSSATAALDAGLFRRYANRLASEPQLA